MLMKPEDVAWNDFWSIVCDAPKESRLALLQSFDPTITPETAVAEVKKRYKERFAKKD